VSRFIFAIRASVSGEKGGLANGRADKFRVTRRRAESDRRLRFGCLKALHASKTALCHPPRAIGASGGFQSVDGLRAQEDGTQVRLVHNVLLGLDVLNESPGLLGVMVLELQQSADLDVEAVFLPLQRFLLALEPRFVLKRPVSLAVLLDLADNP
jgi:hypothetical protein